MATKGEDRRVQRTRKLLLDALMDLILEKGYESVTVQDIIDRANVGRSTFYAHFLDKQQLLLSATLQHDFLTTPPEVAPGAPGGPFLAFSLPIFQHASEHRKLHQAMLGKQSGAILHDHALSLVAGFVRRELAALAPQGGAPGAVPLEAVVQYTVHSFLALLLWWLDQKAPCSPEEMDRTLRALTVPGIKAALKLP